MNLGGDVPGGVSRRVVSERDGIELAGTNDFGALPSVPMQLEAGHTYVVETYDLAGATDTVLELRRQMGAAPAPSDPVIALNDDASGLASRVEWTADRAGTYYAHVRPYAPQTGGTFGLRVVELIRDEASAPETILERANVTLPGTHDFAALPHIGVSLEAGRTYTFETFDLAGRTDTVIELRRGSAEAASPSDPVIARNDDASGLASRIRWTADGSGDYYLHVAPYAPQTDGTFSVRVAGSR